MLYIRYSKYFSSRSYANTSVTSTEVDSGYYPTQMTSSEVDSGYYPTQMTSSEVDSGNYPTQMQRRDWSNSFVYVKIDFIANNSAAKTAKQTTK